MSPRTKKVKTGTQPDSGSKEPIVCTPVSRFKARPKKTNDFQKPISPPQASTNGSPQASTSDSPKASTSDSSQASTNGSNYSPMPSTSSQVIDPFKTPCANTSRQLSSSGVQLYATKALFQERTCSAESSVSTPDLVKATILQGVICYVDCKYNKEDRSIYVQKKCIAMGAKVEKNFTKKVTIVVFKSGKMSTYMKAKERNIPLVSVLWLEACKDAGCFVDPARYPPSDNEEYQQNIPIEEAKIRERFLNRGRAFLDRINGRLPPKPTPTKRKSRQTSLDIE